MFGECKYEHPTATTSTTDFVHRMTEVEGAANGIFVETSGKALKALIEDRKSYDIAICYEANAVQAINSGQQDIRVVYPFTTTEAIFPAATLKGDWVTPQRAEVSKQFIAYLLTSEVQTDSINYGFRPPGMRKSDADTAFSAAKWSDAGIKDDPHTTTTQFDTSVLEDLIYQWNTNVHHR